uniref:EF-hand domain-containing protein n=1 Tax=Schistocephalus solidus TaxID=70667 RepID=A0A0X3P4S3_SCHSO
MTSQGKPSSRVIRCRGNNWNLIVPSVFTPVGPELIAQRKIFKPTRFIERALAETDTRPERQRYAQLRLMPTIRNAILQCVDEARKDPRIHFTGYELGILLHIYFHLTNYQIRAMTDEELQDFLVSTLSLTGQNLLEGLRGAAKMLRYGRPSSTLDGITAYDFVLLLSCMLRGSFTDRATLSFYVLDRDSDGRLRTNVEFAYFLRGSLWKVQEYSDESESDFDHTQQAVQYLASKASITIGGSIGLTRFLQLCSKQPWMIDAILPCIPRDIDNVTFQSIFTGNITTPYHSESPRNSHTPRKRSTSTFSNRRPYAK